MQGLEPEQSPDGDTVAPMGTPPEGPAILPSGVVTFVMTDIEGSTRLWDQEPDAMSLALADHARIVENAVIQCDGLLIKARGEGDSTFSVFVRVSDAIGAVHAMQREVTAHRWPTSVPIRLRIGVHTGEAVPSDGDYVGGVVNRAARLRGLAQPGEALVSSSAASIVCDDLPGGLGLKPLGSVHLKGLDRDEEVLALIGPGLPDVDRLATANHGDHLDEHGVTARERDVLGAVGDRLTNAEIAEQFSVSERTVESHVSALLRKLGVGNRLELSEIAKSTVAIERPELPAMLATASRRSRCVGRGQERVALLDCWRRAERGSTVVSVVTGEAGIGKSRLVADLAVHAHESGALVLLGSSTDGAQTPYQGLADALAAPITHSPEHRLRDDLGRNASLLSRVLPGIARRLGTAAPSGSAADDAAAVKAALHAYIKRLATHRPVLLVIEDLHWATSATRDAILDMARQADASPIMILATTRDVAPDLDDALDGWIARIERLPVTTRIALTGLGLDATAEVLADLAATTDPADALRRSDGNPLLLRELATGGGAGSTMRDFVADRRARLTTEDLDIVDLAAALGESFGLDVLARAAGRPAADVIDSLERAADAGLTQSLTPSATRHSFVHALTRDGCYDALGAGRRLKLHAALADALYDRGDEPSTLPELARHAALAAPLGRADEALDLCRQAGERALNAGDYAAAVPHLERALDIIDLASDAEAVRLPLTIRLGEAVKLDDGVRSRELLHDAARIARRQNDPDQFADAVCSIPTWGGSISPGFSDDSFIHLAEEALELLPEENSFWRSRVLALLGSHLTLSTDLERGRSLHREAVSVAREADDPTAFVHAGLSLRFGLNEYESDECHRLCEEAQQIAERAGLTSLAEVASSALAMQDLVAGRLDDAARWRRRSAELTDAVNVNAYLYDTTVALLQGDLEEAERRNERTAHALPEQYHHLYSGFTQLVIDAVRGEVNTGPLELVLDLDSFVGHIARAGFAYLSLYKGDTERPASMLADARASGFEELSIRPWASGPLGMWAQVAAVVGDVSSAGELVRLLDPLAGRFATMGPTMIDSVDLARGLVQTTIGDHDQAISTLEGAVATSRARGTLLPLGRELVALAAAHAAVGDGTPIGPLVAEALDIAQGTGAAIIEADVEVRLGPEPR